ncbi:MAG: hypothetical protein HZB41_02680 [Ignavibacteriae bacterium]|nr:hypothetical protein [Ignavibacteriota bacterium]
MEPKVSNAQIEVWEWKVRAYESIKDIPKDKRIEFIMKSVQNTVDLIKVKQKENLEQVIY